jgi:hypothetical protein
MITGMLRRYKYPIEYELDPHWSPKKNRREKSR